tara:strand:+ start:10920 stop:11822 length:903 start_codon:yes stop_codon:yes gene_type:complete
MKTKKISEKFYGNGTYIYSDNKKFSNLDRDKVIKIFEEKGMIIFRDFEINPKQIIEITDAYTSKYANDAQRRKNRLGQKQVHEVDYGNNEMALHSEASFSPNWPEIVWFFCNVPPPKNSGPTTFCDGIKLWDSLTIETKNFFLTHPLEYLLEVPIGYKKIGAKKKKWLLNYNGTGDGILDLNKGVLKMKHIRFAATESRLTDKLCFSNHVLYQNTDPTIKKWGTFGQKKIPKKILKNVKENSDKLIFEHNWKKFDLVMLDNKRFMHGRRKFNFKEKRDILNIQTAKANFAYGETIRSNLK